MGLSEEGVRAFVTVITMFERKRYAQMYFYLKQIRDELMQLIDNHRGNNDGLNPQTQNPISIPIMSSGQDNQEQLLLEILEELKAIRKDLKS